MKSAFKKLPGSKIELEAALDQNEFRGYWQTAYDRALASVELKGFRPGMAPKELADKAVDKEKVFEEAVQQAARFGLDELSKEKDWTIIDTPEIELQDSSAGLKYKARLTVFPEIRLGNYKKIAKKVLAEKKAVEADPQEIEQSLKWLINSRAKITRVDRGACQGDLVDIDLESSVDSFKNDQFVLGESRFMPGFEDNLKNRQAGETVKFSLKAPEDYWNEKLRGQTINFKVKVNGVLKRELPELNDEFASSLGSDFKNVEDLKKSISDGLRQEKEIQEAERLRIKMLEEIVKSSKMEIPDIMINKTLDNMMADYKPVMERPGKTKEELKEQWRERAKQNVANHLVIYKISEIENLRPTPEEVRVDNKQNYDYNYSIVQNRKVFSFLESLK